MTYSEFMDKVTALYKANLISYSTVLDCASKKNKPSQFYSYIINSIKLNGGTNGNSKRS